MKLISNLLKYKKILGLVLAVSMIASMIIPATVISAADPTSMSLIAPATAARGATINVDLQLAIGTNLTRGWQANVTYDPAILTFVSVTEGPMIKTFAGIGNTYFNPGTQTAGRIAGFAEAQTGGPAGGATGTGVVATLQFTVNAGAVYAPTAISFDATPGENFIADQTSAPYAGTLLNNGSTTIVPPAPAITSFSPTFGGTGTIITINGSNLDNLVTVDPVMIGGIAATDVTGTATQITAKVAAGAASGSVIVNTLGGTATRTGFILVAPATITNVAPLAGTLGTAIVITGTNFDIAGVPSNVQSVTFGGVALSSVVATSTSITANMPLLSVNTTAPIIVTTRAGAVTSSQQFVYTAPKGALYTMPLSQSVVGGFPFSVDVMLDVDATQPIRGWQSNFSFDASKLQFVDATFAPTNAFETYAAANAPLAVVGAPGWTYNNTTGTITGLGQALVGPAGSGLSGAGLKVVTLNFTATSSYQGDTMINATNSMYSDPNGNSYTTPIQNVGSTITITAVACPVVVPDPQTSNEVITAQLSPVLTFVAPWDVCCWNLEPSQKNAAMRTLTVFSNANWQVSASGSNNGKMTGWNGSSYVALPSTYQLANPLSINGTALTGSPTVIAAGSAYDQRLCPGGDMKDLLFVQPVLYTDRPMPADNSLVYRLVVTYSAANISW